MKRFAPFFTRRIFIVCFFFDIPLSLITHYKYISTRHIPYFTVLSGKLYINWLVINFVVLLLIFFILYCISNRNKPEAGA